ncbi:glutamate receptor isoform X2 [Patella vulgata]|uniref:glutamate receptor isoform X2 n=1 Tax=Patella vulgata TaxID=6465 RepID=UPI0021803F9C|nr:glutamate receptor isoform X2 [Patella vulgata]
MRNFIELCLEMWLFIHHIGGTAVQTDIPLGAIFDYKADAAARSGYLYAISVYNDTSKDALSFATVYDELDITDNFRVASKICSQMAGGIFAFYGKTDTKSFSIIQSFSNAFRMPYITFSLCGTADQREKPYVVFIKPSYTDAITDIIKTFGWTRMDYIYDSDEGLMRVQYIYNKLKEANFTNNVDIGFRRVEDINNAHADLRRLDRYHADSAKNVILDLSSQEAYRKILKQIPEVGMNRDGYNYLMGTLDMLSLNLTRFRHGGVNITGFQLVNHSSPRVQTFLREWGSLESTVWPGAGRPILDVDAALSFDAVETISKALKMMIQRQERVFQYTFRRAEVFNYNKTKGIPCINPVIPWMHGQDIYNSIKKVGFHGLTGHVAFDGRGYRRDYKFDVLTVSLNNGPEKIGEWGSRDGLKSVYDVEETGGWNYTKSKLERTVVSILTAPFLMINNKSEMGRPPTGNDRYEGYCKDLAEVISKQLGISYILVLVEDSKYGSELDNGSWDGIIGALRRGVKSIFQPA